MENFEKIILPWQDWKIVNYLGSGAYGKVYEIERNASGIQEKAALKIVTRPKDAGELEADYQNGYDKESISAKYTQIFQEYRNEYKLMKELQGQSNIVSCDDFFIEENPDGIGGKIYIRMELLTSLQKETRERLLPEEEVIRLGKDICKALILCESRNIIHRDIKPDNVMIYTMIQKAMLRNIQFMKKPRKEKLRIIRNMMQTEMSLMKGSRELANK